MPRVFSKILHEQVYSFSDLNNTTRANPALVSQGFEYASTQTNVQNKLPKTISRLIRGIPPLSIEQNA